jgi:phage terminase small subunit
MTTLPPRMPLRATPLNDTKPDRPLSTKQRRFVDEYLLDMNANAAAIRAGYSERSAYQHGSFLTKRPNVAAAISQVLAARRERLAVTAERVIHELARIAFADIGRIMDWSEDGATVRPPAELSEDDRAAIAEIAVVKGEKSLAARVMLHDKERALEALCRHLGLYAPPGQWHAQNAIGTAAPTYSAELREKLRVKIEQRVEERVEEVLAARAAAEGRAAEPAGGQSRDHRGPTEDTEARD